MILNDIVYYGRGFETPFYPSHHATDAKERFDGGDKLTTSQLNSYWSEMSDYLEYTKNHGNKKASIKKILVKNELFVLSIVATLLIFFVLPFAMLMAAGMPLMGCIIWSALIWVATSLGIISTAKIISYDSRNDISEYEKNHMKHDDGDNDLDEIRSIVKSLDNIDSALRQDYRSLISSDRFPDCCSEMRRFRIMTMQYIILSYWLGHEKRIASGFDELVMRTSAAWKAYLELLDDNSIAQDDIELATEHINTVIEHNLNTVYRNFNRVDAKINGEDHIFDIPDAPRMLSNMEKLSIAAAIAKDGE